MGAGVKVIAIGALVVLIANGKHHAGSHGGSLLDFSAKSAAAAAAPAGLSGNRALGAQMAADRGWTGGQWSCLDWLWTRESGWNQYAQNPTSTAYGIAQFLDSTWGLDGGGPKTSSAPAQIADGLDYIRARYGSPCAAWAHETQSNWY
jgi:resuscitation-promoting factor RpfB